MARRKSFKVKGQSLAEYRAMVEFEAFPATALMARVVNYNLLAYAVGQNLGHCEGCGSMGCDVRTATLATVRIREDLTVQRVFCAECGKAWRGEYWASHVEEWIWGAELCDAETVRAARFLS